MERSDLSVSPNGGSQDSSADSEFGNHLETLHCRPVTREILREARSHVGHRDDGLPYTAIRNTGKEMAGLLRSSGVRAESSAC